MAEITIASPDVPLAAANLHWRQRTRMPGVADLSAITWLAPLEADLRHRVTLDLQIMQVEPGEVVCEAGRPAEQWLGLIDGLLKISPVGSGAPPPGFTGLAPGAWFGEGALLKRDDYRWRVEALRRSQVASLPARSFFWLLDQSIAFNRYVLNQLNERMSQYVASREIDRLSDPDLRVARHLASLFHPVLYPGVGSVLRITQQELGAVVGLSRQRVNEALKRLQAAQMVRVEYGGVRVLDLERLRHARLN